MSSREITVWLDERWCEALEKQHGKSVNAIVDEFLDEALNQLPEHTYEKISAEIHAECLAAQQEVEAAKKYTAFRITEHGENGYWQIDRPMEFMYAARVLRSYLRNERSADSFLQMIHRPEQISAERFEELARLRMENTGKVAGAYHLDFGRQRMDALHIMDGWQSFRMEDVSVAAYHAFRKDHLSDTARWERFTDHLMGKELTYEPQHISEATLIGSRRLRPEDISIGEDIIQNDHLLEFYLETVFDTGEVFGLPLDRKNTDDSINIYANYDMEIGAVCDLLEVYVVRGSGEEQSYQYRLNAEEQATVLGKMESYVQQQWGQSIEECCEQYHMKAPTPEQVLKEVERSRVRMHEIVDERFDNFVRKAVTEDGQKMSSSLPLGTNLAAFKGEKPAAIFLPGQGEIPVKNWKKAVATILQDCNADPQRHERLMELRNKVYGNFRTILADKPDGMSAPLEIDEGLYFESKFDTEALLRVLTTKVLDEVGYEYHGILVQLRDPKQEQSMADQKRTAPAFGMRMK